MKNITISKKLILGFGILLILLLLSMFISIFSINSVAQQVELFSEYSVPNTEHIWSVKRDLVSVQRYLLEGYIHEDNNALKDNISKANADAAHLRDVLDEFTQNQRDNSQEKLLGDISSILEKSALAREKLTTLLQTDSAESMAAVKDVFWNEYVPTHNQIEGILDQITAAEDASAQKQRLDGDNAVDSSRLLLISFSALSLLLAVTIGTIIRKSIMNPVKEIEGVYGEMAKGNMQVSISYDSRDELGSMAKSIKKTNALLASYIQDITDKLSQMSRGDMRVNIDLDYIGDFAAIKQAMLSTAHALNHTLQTINVAAEQVSTGATQVASGAQALAAGSTEQASSVEQLSVSVAKIAEQAEENSVSVKDATRYVEQAVSNVQDGSEHMKQLTDAMTNIGAASDQITNITKVIEDIAFQTNILALNAAIEAARAGNAGKGFAVVADEVRNLAAKSAEAAKKTAELIQRSTATVAEGSQVAAQTAAILKSVEEKANLVNESIIKIDYASSAQAAAIEQVKQGLNQVSSVVQTNATTAEENSATSEEMSAQAATLQEEVGKFTLDSGYEDDGVASISLLKEQPRAPKQVLQRDNSFG